MKKDGPDYKGQRKGYDDRGKSGYGKGGYKDQGHDRRYRETTEEEIGKTAIRFFETYWKPLEYEDEEGNVCI